MELLNSLPNSTLLVAGLIIIVCLILLLVFMIRPQNIHNTSYHIYNYPSDKKDDKEVDVNDQGKDFQHGKTEKHESQCDDNIARHEDYHRHSKGGATLLRQRSVANTDATRDHPPPYSKNDIAQIQYVHDHDYPSDRNNDKEGDVHDKEGHLPHEKNETKEQIEFQLGGNFEEHEDLGYQVRQNEGVTSEDDTTLVGQRSVAKSSVTHDQPPPYSKTEDRKFSGDKEPNVTKQAFRKDKNGVKAFLEDSSKTVPKDVRNVENNNSKNETSKKSKTPSPDISTKPQALSLQKSSDVEIVKIPQIIIESPIEMFSFTVDERGCNVSSPYCKLHFAPGATEESITIRMQPEYDITTTILGKMFISPIINFTSENKMLFQKNVMVSIHTTYTAADSDKKIPVQVIWRKDSQTLFENHIQKLDHGNERFITFECKHFCGYSIVADETQFQNMQRHYYSAAYVRQPRNQETRFLHWLIFEDCPHAKADNRQYLSERDTVIDPEGFAIRYNYNLQLRMNCEGVQIHANNQRPNLVEKWGSRFTESYQFKIMKCQEVDDSPIEYEIMAMHCQNHATYQVIQKHFYMEWLYEALAPNVVVNAHDSSTGLSINNPTCGRGFHHQISQASSGYESVTQSPSAPNLPIHEEFSHPSMENEQPPVQQEDGDDIMVTDYDVDDASIATVPKSEATISEDDGGFASLSNESQSFSLSPLAQSTPNSTRVETIAKEDRDSMMCDEKGFSNS